MILPFGKRKHSRSDVVSILSLSSCWFYRHGCVTDKNCRRWEHYWYCPARIRYRVLWTSWSMWWHFQKDHRNHTWWCTYYSLLDNCNMIEHSSSSHKRGNWLERREMRWRLWIWTESETQHIPVPQSDPVHSGGQSQWFGAVQLPPLTHDGLQIGVWQLLPVHDAVHCR